MLGSTHKCTKATHVRCNNTLSLSSFLLNSFDLGVDGAELGNVLLEDGPLVSHISIDKHQIFHCVAILALLNTLLKDLLTLILQLIECVKGLLDCYNGRILADLFSSLALRNQCR